MFFVTQRQTHCIHDVSLTSNFNLLLFRTDFVKQMIRMSKAATNASSSLEDDDNDSCNIQGIYNKDKRFILADDILLYIIDIRPDLT